MSIATAGHEHFWETFSPNIQSNALMNAISNRYDSGKAALLAFESGIDLILMPEDADEAIDAGWAATAVVPAEHDPSLENLKNQQRVFFASRTKHNGIIDGLNHYRFLSS